MKHIRIIKLRLPAKQAKMGGELGAILGQYNLNILKFCNEFNVVSQSYQEGLLINVDLLVLEGNSFEIRLRGPSTRSLIDFFSEGEKISLLNLVKIAQINRISGDSAPIKAICKNLISYIKSLPITVAYE